MIQTNIIKIKNWSEVPENYSGIIEWQSGDKWWYKEGFLHREDGPAIEEKNGIKYWYKEGKCHREDGPAVEESNGSKEWRLENCYYSQIKLKDYIVLDQYQGPCNIAWYKLLDKNRIFEYPDIPGLIEK